MSIIPARKTPRNLAILDEYLAGERAHIIGKKHGVTKQRVIQIARALGAPPRIYEPKPGETGWMMCKVEDCTETARSRWSTLCNKHYFRGRRTGTTDERRRRGPSLTSHGYLAQHWKGHPAASKSGILYEHRRVFFEACGPDGHSCYWCNDPLAWGGGGHGKLHVDHLNGDKTDCEMGNLVPSCHRCNINRGLFMSWLTRHKDDPIIRALFNSVG